MKINCLIISCAILITSSGMTKNHLAPPLSPAYLLNQCTLPFFCHEQDRPAAPLFIPPLLASDNGKLEIQRQNPAWINKNLSDLYSVQGIKSEYFLVNGRSQIKVEITTLAPLLITAYLFDINGKEQAQTEEWVNNQSKELMLALENLSHGRYRLVIKALDADGRSAIKVHHISLINRSMTTPS